MFLVEQINSFLQYPLFKIGATAFYCLVVVALIQAGKWRWPAIAFAVFISGALMLSCIFTAPNDVIGTGGGIALPQESKDLFVVALGGLLGCVIASIIAIFKNKNDVNTDDTDEV